MLIYIYRQNPAVTNPAQTAKIFQHVVKALEAETIQGNTANKVVASTKALVAAMGVNAQQIIQEMGLSPEGVAVVQAFFQ